jgi:Ca2+-binding EF-hand superfamily protein
MADQKDKKRNNPRQTLTKEMIAELDETFSMLVNDIGVMPYSKLPLALFALGMKMSESNESGTSQQLQYDLSFDRFMQVVVDCMERPNWAANEMSETFYTFDKALKGYIDEVDVMRLFNKLGEKMTEEEIMEQLQEVDLNRNMQISPCAELGDEGSCEHIPFG